MRHVGILPDLPTLPLPGDHQRRNASLACAVAQAAGYSIEPQHLAQTQWPARGERFGQLILDCAHNPSAIKILGEWVRAQHQGPIHVIFGAMEGKDVGPMVKNIEEWADSASLVTPNYPRRLAAAELVQYFERLNPSVIDDVRHAVDDRPNSGLTVVCGSGFLAGEVRAHLTGVSFPECGIVTTAR